MNQALAIKEKAALKGVYVITKAKLETPEQFALNDKVVAARARVASLVEKLDTAKRGGLWAMWTAFRRETLKKQLQEAESIFIGLTRELNRICKTEKMVFENIVPTVGRTMIANNLTDATPDNVMRIKYAEVGTSTQAPANGDTALIASTYRNTIASETNAANIAYATAFFGATEVTGTFRECGIFADGTASAGTGILVSRVAINVTKSSSETLTIDWTLTIT